MAKPLIDIAARGGRETDKAVLKKAKNRMELPEITLTGGEGILNRIKLIQIEVPKAFENKKDQLQCIRDKDEFIDYVDQVIKIKHAAIDTETDGTNPIINKLAGLCLYAPGLKSVYVPSNHINYITGQQVPNQISTEIISQQLLRIHDADVFIDMFNADFDVRIIKHNCGFYIRCDWDGYIGGVLLNENEEQGFKNLKALHTKYVRKGEEDFFKYRDLFKNLPFTIVPIDPGYMYAANDTIDTYELGEFQRQYLDPSNPKCIKARLQDVSYVMTNIEMPLVPVVASMEDRGIGLNIDTQKKLSEKYTKLRDQSEKRFFKECEQYGEDIDSYRRRMGVACKLGNPININSSAQLAILLYDIIKLKPPVIKKRKNSAQTDRGTGVESLEKLDHPICKTLLNYRKYEKLLGTYIDKMPKELNPKTNKIHTNFNQVGTVTGRFSAKDPSLHNIPAKAKDIRTMFTASPGHVLISADFSSQEPRITAHLSEDKKMIQAFIDGKDIYAEIASIAFKLPYEACLEKFPDGTENPDPEGKVRRGRAKAIVLGEINAPL